MEASQEQQDNHEMEEEEEKGTLSPRSKKI
jgi:hypothetical protein